LLIDLCLDRCDPATLPDAEVGALGELAARLNVESCVLGRLGPHQRNLGAGAARWLDGLRRRVMEVAVNNLRRDGELAEALARLAEGGVDLLFLKGSALRAGRQGLAGRFQCDVDVLLRRSDLEQAEALLLGLGFRLDESFQCREDLLRNHFHFGYERRGAVIELHWDVDPNSPAGFVDRLWNHSRQVETGEGEVRVPSPEHQLLFDCLHLSRHAFVAGLRWLADLNAQLPLSPDLAARFEEEARAWPRRAVYAPLWLLDVYGVPGLEPMAERLGATSLEETLLRSVVECLVVDEPWHGLPAWRAAKALEAWMGSDRAFPALLGEVSTRGVFRKLHAWAGNRAPEGAF
jgi:hypothetical protein